MHMTDVPSLTPDIALFLDFDGTLVDFALRPDAVRVAPDVVPALDAVCHRLDGAIAIVTGRPIADIDAFLAPLTLPIAGLHGLEHRYDPAGDVVRDPPGEDIHTLRDRILASPLLNEGVTLEDKGATLALHYRAVPERREDALELMRAATADLKGLHLIDGKMVVEAKPARRNKGSALKAFMTLPAFRGRRPVFIGDDLTDEDGMRAAIELGGYAIKVGQGGTCAPFRLADVAAVHNWLNSFIPALET